MLIGIISLSFKHEETRKLTENVILVQGADSEDEAYIAAEELSYDIEEGDFAENSIPGLTAEGETNGTIVDICPGKGVRCRVMIVDGNHITSYSGWKRQGSKDVVISAS